ncbi:MAG: hypothetical protein KIT56_05650 [Gammaproteobacteria bacterium]|nr:hypothetical protein [Gammaproteobacteria bacterium]MCW5583355.1 hypothetical protein [Gammaproteobacteria bacterium]
MLPTNKKLNNIGNLLEEYKKLNTYTDRKKFLDDVQQDLASFVTSGLVFDKILSIIKEPALQKQIIFAIINERFSIDEINDTLLIEILINKIHPEIRREFALYLGPQRIRKLFANDSTGDRFKLIIGKDNQVENLKKVLSFEDFKEIYYSPNEFKWRFSEIQQSEQISFIKDFIGIDNFLTLNYPILMLEGVLKVLAPNARYSFLINDLGINNFKKIMYDKMQYSSFYHKRICDLLPEEDFILLCKIIFTEEQQLARSKLDAYRDAIENTNFITTAGKCSNSLHGCVEVETRDGKKKLVSDTAKYILFTIEEHNYVLSNHVSTLTKVKEICRKAITYDKIRPEFKEGVFGSALKFAIWMTRTNEAIELYTQIVEDKIQGIQISHQIESKKPLSSMV